jgi:hypothetical protein
MFKQLSSGNLSDEGRENLEQQMDENKQKLSTVKKFLKEVNTFVENVEALEAENRADLLTMFN